MKKLFIFFLLASSPLLADDCTVTAAIISIRPGAGWSMSNNDPSTLVWVSTQTQPTLLEIQNVVDACNLANTPVQKNLKARSDAINDLLTSTDDRAKEVRAILMTLFDENNNNREWIQAFKGQVALATSLADLKTRVATLPDMPDRTVQQAQTAVQSKINSGASD